MHEIQKRIYDEVALHFKAYHHVFRRGDLLLDIGPGSGFTAHYIQSQTVGLSVVGLDINSLLQVDLPLVLYDGQKFPFRDNAVNVSLLFYVLHHTRFPFEVVNEATRIAKRTILVIEEFELPHADHQANLDKEKEALEALGLPNDLFFQNLLPEEIELWFNQCNLITEQKRYLATKSERAINKCLYILHKRE